MRPDLAALVSSRICHDLISPIGAIGNGVELLALTEGETGAEMDLISQSVDNANARIRFFRIAFGAANEGQILSRVEILSVLDAASTSGRIKYHWDVHSDQPRQFVRSAFLLLQCFESALPLGGEIRVTEDKGAWAVNVVSNRVNVDSTLWGNLTDPNVPYNHSAAQVQFALLPTAIIEAKRTLAIDIKDNEISARF